MVNHRELAMNLTINGIEYAVEAKETAGQLSLTVNGERHEIPFTRLGDGRVRVEIAGRSVLAWSNGKFAACQGRTREICPVAEGPRRPVAQLSVPMPALVSSVLVAVGDKVEAGQKLVLCSAMKTEIVVRAPRAGIVQHILAVVGAQVEPGIDLVTLGE